MTTDYTYEVTDLSRQFKLNGHVIPVIKEANFSIKTGEWVALIGRSGSGKTTLLHLLGLLDKQNSGEILCNGNYVKKMSSRKKADFRYHEIGFIFQNYHLFPELSAWENVMLPALKWNHNRNKMAEKAKELLIKFGLGERLHHRPRELSGGEQQRVVTARALINDPDIILADEPTGNLDLSAGNEIIKILQHLHKEEKKTIVMVTHDLDLAKVADRVLMIKQGKVLAYNSSEDHARNLQEN